MLLDECEVAGVRVEIGCSVEDVRQRDGGGFALRTSRGPFTAASLVVASGGLSIPSTGASGFGYRLAQQFGHAVLPTRAGLVPLTLSGTHLERLEGLSGVSLPVEASCNGKSFNNRSEEHTSELQSLMRISYAVLCLKQIKYLL